MFGAFIGDIVGSAYEFSNIHHKDFPLFTTDCDFTDDSIMTAAVAQALLLCREARFRGESKPLSEFMVEQMQLYGHRFPNPTGAYGGRFAQWLRSEPPQPYYSCGNGSAMRVSPCGIIAVTVQEARILARISAAVTHNHPEGIKGAEAVAAAVYLAKTYSKKDHIRQYIQENFYPLTEDLDTIRATNRFDETCQGTVPQAITAFLESESFEDAIRNAISIGGDSDTIGAITGSIAWAFYRAQIPAHLPRTLPEDMRLAKEAATQFLPADFVELDNALHEVAVLRFMTISCTESCKPIATDAEWELHLAQIQ